MGFSPPLPGMPLLFFFFLFILYPFSFLFLKIRRLDLCSQNHCSLDPCCFWRSSVFSMTLAHAHGSHLEFHAILWSLDWQFCFTQQVHVNMEKALSLLWIVRWKSRLTCPANLTLRINKSDNGIRIR